MASHIITSYTALTADLDAMRNPLRVITESDNTAEKFAKVVTLSHPFSKWDQGATSHVWTTGRIYVNSKQERRAVSRKLDGLIDKKYRGSGGVENYMKGFIVIPTLLGRV